jgi:thiamine-phosphate pyrophosphorylase
MAEAKPRCRLYLQVPASALANIDAIFAQAIAGTDAACVLLCHDEEPIDEICAGRLLNLAHERGLACLIEDDVELALRIGADGVHINADAASYARARDRLGKEAIVGAGCGLRRHDAMTLAELGADYVAFDISGIDEIDQQAELIAWWSEIFVVPCVAWNIATPEEAERFARLGADFVAISREIWRGDTAPAVIAGIGSAIGQVRRAA